MPTHRAARPAGLGQRRELLFKALASSFLFAYVGFILAVLLADVWWLGGTNELTGETYFHAVLTDRAVYEEVWAALRLSLVTSLITTALAMVVAIPAAYSLSRYTFRGAALIDTMIDLPIVLPPLIAGLSLLAFFGTTSVGRAVDEFLGRYLAPPYNGIVHTRVGIVVAQFFIGSAFATRALKAIFDQINPRFEGVARSLGCTPWQAFWKITLPLARNGLVAGGIMTWARALGEFAPIMMLAGTMQENRVLPVAAFMNMNEGRVEVAIAFTLLMVLIGAVTLVAFKKLGGQGYLW
jgi:molybdate transport system permease protein